MQQDKTFREVQDFNGNHIVSWNMLPGEKMRIDGATIFKSNGIKLPTLEKAKIREDYFFCPFRLLNSYKTMNYKNGDFYKHFNNKLLDNKIFNPDKGRILLFGDVNVGTASRGDDDLYTVTASYSDAGLEKECIALRNMTFDDLLRHLDIIMIEQRGDIWDWFSIVCPKNWQVGAMFIMKFSRTSKVFILHLTSGLSLIEVKGIKEYRSG